MPKQLPTLIFLLSHFLTQCQSPYREIEHNFPYDFSAPTDVLELDSDLNEISGLAWWGEDTLIAIEDEHADIYFLSAQTGKILMKSDFGDDGDYEGIAVHERQIYVLRSDGDVYRVENPLKEEEDGDKNETDLSEDNNTEGLHFDQGLGALLIACKEDGGTEGYRAIYKLTPGEKDVNEKPFLLIDEARLLKQLHMAYGDRFSSSFKPSGISRHPINNDLYILSAANSLLASFDTANVLKEVIRLPYPYAEQIEGICFDPNGNLFISSEGSNGTIATFQMIVDE